MKLIPDPEYPARYTELVELQLGLEGSPAAGRGWAHQILNDGLEGLLMGKSDIAMRCLRVAVKYLVPPIEHAKNQTYTPNTVVSQQRSADEKSRNAIVSQVVQLGFTAFTDGYIWRGNGLAYWLLNALDDTQSFRMAVELLWQHFSAHPDELRDGVALDSLSAILFDTGLDDECIRCVSQGKYFTEPKAPRFRPRPPDNGLHIESPPQGRMVDGRARCNGPWTRC